MEIVGISRKVDLFEIGAEFALGGGRLANDHGPALRHRGGHSQSHSKKRLDSAWSEGKNVRRRVNTQIPVSPSSEFRNWPEAMSRQTNPLQVSLLFRRL